MNTGTSVSNQCILTSYGADKHEWMQYFAVKSNTS